MTERVLLRPLHIHNDGGDWIVGRKDTGVFVALPPVGVQVINLLRDGVPVGEVPRHLDDEVDVAEFVDQLVALRFVAELDGRPVADARTVTSSFPRVRPHHVRWLLTPFAGVAAAGIVLAGLVAVAVQPGLVPGPRDVLWTGRGSLVILSQLLATWGSIFLHEMAHLFTARAAGVPGKVRLGTRLQFLCAQTDVSGVWSEPRRVRIVVYLSGMVVNLCLAALGIAVIATVPGPVGHAAGAVLFLTQIGLLVNQFLCYMRTDVYFVIQDIARCKNLYGDAGDYLRFLARRLAGRRGDDPSLRLPVRERRIVRWYSALLLPGTVASIAFFLAVTLPILVALLGDAFTHVLRWGSAAEVVDGLVVGANIIGLKVVWAWAWWRRHGDRVRQRLAAIGRPAG